MQTITYRGQTGPNQLADTEKLTQAEGEINVNREDKQEKLGLG